VIQSAEIPVAHSALLTVDANQNGDSIALFVRRSHDHSVVSSNDVTVSVDGKNEPVSHDSNGGYSVPAADLRGDGERPIEIIVGHDGIREILSGKIAVQAATESSFLSDHRQIGWWVLNIVIVLIAAIILSRRKS
jgi:hypothetical protein